jgi:hypothetical protein
MPYLPYRPPKESYCHRCGARLNHYGYCPNKKAHEEEDIQRQREIKKRKEQEEAIKELIDSALVNEPIPFIPDPHICVWEKYGDDSHSCKVCGKIVFNKDYPELFRKGG